MIVRAPRPQGNFYILDKVISEDGRLSWGARGLLVYLLGKPDHWQVSPAALVNDTAASSKPSGRDAVYSLLGELRTVGYVRREQPRGADGALLAVRYLVSETPQPENTEAAPLTALPLTAQPLPANPTQVSIEGEVSIDDEVNTKKKKETPAAATNEGVSFDFQQGVFVGLECDQKGRWQLAYPATNVDTEILRAAIWLQTNPANRKSNYARFLTNWLNRAQDRAPVTHQGAFHAQQSSGYGRRPSASDQRVDFMQRLTGRSRDDGGTIEMPH